MPAHRYEWKINAGTVVYSELERLRAQVSSGKFDVVAAWLEHGRNSLTDDLHEALKMENADHPLTPEDVVN